MTPAETDSLIYRVAFASMRGITPALAAGLMARLGSEQAFFEASEQTLASLTGTARSGVFGRAYRDERLERARREADFIIANDITPVYHTDPGYPHRLREAEDAPLMLYTLGQADLNSEVMIGVVGTRHATSYGIGFVDSLIEGLAAKLTARPVIVSGLALGIDIAAHRAAIRHGLPTVAVLAHGLNTIYPAVNRSTAVSMAHGAGLLVTDYLSSDPIHKGNFLARNRIVAGLVDCLIVVESAAKGGALITARIADGYSRDVFAVPGRLGDRYSAGCNRLIASQQAQLITGPDDLIEAMRWPVREAEPEQLELFPALSADDQAIIDLLAERGEARPAEIALALNRPVGKVMASLVDLEFKGRVTAFPGGLYRPG